MKYTDNPRTTEILSGLRQGIYIQSVIKKHRKYIKAKRKSSTMLHFTVDRALKVA